MIYCGFEYNFNKIELHQITIVIVIDKSIFFQQQKVNIVICVAVFDIDEQDTNTSELSIDVSDQHHKQIHFSPFRLCQT